MGITFVDKMGKNKRIKRVSIFSCLLLFRNFLANLRDKFKKMNSKTLFVLDKKKFFYYVNTMSFRA